VQCSAVQCSAVQCSAVQCSAVQCSAVQCSAVQCSAVQWATLHCRRLHEYDVTEDQLQAADNRRVRVESYRSGTGRQCSASAVQCSAVQRAVLQRRCSRSDNESAGEGTSGRGFRAHANYYKAGEDKVLTTSCPYTCPAALILLSLQLS
jgi:hypothetical protein